MQSVVCVFLIHGLLVNTFPTSDHESNPEVLMELPVSGVAEFSGTAPAAGSVAIVGHAPCPELLLNSSSNAYSRNLPQTVEKEDATFTEFDEASPPKLQDYDKMESNDPIPKKVILGALLADSIMAKKGREIDVKLAELDALVEKVLGTIGLILKTALTNTDTSEIDSSVDSALLEMKSQISSELSRLDKFIGSELTETEELVETVIKNVEAIIVEHPENIQTAYKESVASIEKDALIELKLEMLDSFVESTLEKLESLVEFELGKINASVKSELAKVDTVVESELAKVDLFIEKEMENIDALVKSKLSKMDSFVENELARVEKTVEESVDSVTASSDTALIISNSDGSDMQQTNENQVRTVVINGTFPVSGKTLIIGSTGCPPPFPTGEPLPLYVESFPVFETADYDESYVPEFLSEDLIYEEIDDGCIIKLPIKGEAVFSGVAPAVGTCEIMGTCSCDSLVPVVSDISPPTVGDVNPTIPLKQAVPYSGQYFTISENNESTAETEPVLYHKKRLPIVKIVNLLKPDQKPIGAIMLKGEVEFRGNAEAAGSTAISCDFPCPPLTASEEGPDGKKYIWIAKKPCDK